MVKGTCSCASRPTVALCATLLATSASAAVPTSWRATYAPTNRSLVSAAYGTGKWVVVGTLGTIVTSSDGFYWTLVPHNLGSQAFSSVVYGNGKFVLGGSGSALLSSSTDGINWTRQISGTGNDWISGVAFGDGRFVAVGTAGSSVPRILFSTNGTGWETVVSPTANTLTAVAYGNNRFVAVGTLGAVISSSDGRNWAAHSSGTQQALYAITHSGSRFIAGGEGATIVTSVDGISWSPAAPPAFNVRGLAAGDGAVIAVGLYQGSQPYEGRYHASSDGITWPGAAQTAPEMLFGISYANGRFLALGDKGLILQSGITTAGQVNSWTKTSSGYWEEPFWSLGELPSSAHSRIIVNNSGFKAVAIGANTTANYSNALRIQSLYIDAPSDSGNLLLLNWSGLTTPLEVMNEIIIGPNGSLLSHYSAIRAGSLHIDGRATFTDFAQSQFDLVYLGSREFGELQLSNGWFSARQLVVASGGPAWMTQAGGTNQVDSMFVLDGGIYNLQAGELEVRGDQALLLAPGKSNGLSAITMDGGTLKLGSGGMRLGNSPAEFKDARGQVSMTGGIVDSPYIEGFNGIFYQHGGTNNTDYLYFPARFASKGGQTEYRLYGGGLNTWAVALGLDVQQNAGVFQTIGLFYQTGGVHTNRGGIGLYGHVESGFTTSDGVYDMRGGTLDTPWLMVDGGEFRQYGGTNHLGEISVRRFGTFALSRGPTSRSELYSDNVSLFTDAEYPGGRHANFHHSDSKHVIRNALTLERKASYGFYGSLLSVPTISIGPESSLWLVFGDLLNERIILNGGRLVPMSVPQCGSLVLSSGPPSTIDFSGELGWCRFQDSRTTAWDLYSTLRVSNWNSRTDRFYVGNSARGLTPAQLARITFVRPDNLAGEFPARILNTGEVVPAGLDSVAYRRTSSGLVLTWPAGYQLFTSTNVNGPYQVISNAFSPYPISLTDPRRFFLIRTP